jgi:UDP-N-acetylmuramate--alanine ligase
MRIPVMKRADMLVELMRLKQGIAVAGAHGKTTTTSMISEVLRKGGLDPTIVIGGKFNNISSHAQLGNGEYMVVEADESDGTFLKLSPLIGVVTNIDNEHLDCYKDLEEIKDAFIFFINKLPFYGCAVLCIDDKNVRSLISKVERRYITYGLDEGADIRAAGIRRGPLYTEFETLSRGVALGEVKINASGLHYVRNALAAVAVGLEVGLEFPLIKKGLLSYKGVERRFQVRGKVDDILFLDDYAHHPTEIKATLEAARLEWGERRFIVVFQPHRYTRTFALAKEFGTSFTQAQIIIITKIYPAGEEPIKGVDGALIAKNILKSTHQAVKYIPDEDELIDFLHQLLTPRDLVITLGAGDVWKIGEKLIERLKCCREK